MMASNKRIKTILNRLPKLIDFPETYEDLQSIIRNLYKLAHKEIRNMGLTYIDDEGDKVSVSNTFDLHQAKIFIEKEDSAFLEIDIYLPEIDLSNQMCDFINATTESIPGRHGWKDLNQEEYTDLYKKIDEINLNDDNGKSISLPENTIKKPAFKESAYYLKKKNRKLSKNSQTEEAIVDKEKDNSPEEDLDRNKLEEIVSNLVKKKMDNFKEKLINKTKKKTDKLLKQMLKKKQRTQELEKDKEIHRSVICDGCGIHPIIGVRYKCSVCENFDYCEECEEKHKDEHPHPFIKIRKSELNSMHIKCTLAEDVGEKTLLKEIFKMKIPDPLPPQKQTMENKSNILLDNFVNKDKQNISDRETYFLDLTKNMKILYDLSSVDDSIILESLKKANGNMDEALIFLFN